MVSAKLPVLLVDDEASVLRLFESALRASGISSVVAVQNSARVPELLAEQTFSLILLDLVMPHPDGQELLGLITRDHPGVPVMVVTGLNEVETAVQCMKAGALDYLVKPVDDNRLLATVRRALELRDLRLENERLRSCVIEDRLAHPEAFAHIVTANAAMQRLFRYIDAVAVSSHPVLVTGETVVGKELIAQAVHYASGRLVAFVPVNIARLEDSLFSYALFGHQRGAFTGADESRAGLVEKADGGTLFLDEIGDLSAGSQVKILRLIQEREYFPLGASAPKRTDARIVVATHQDLDQLQNEGRLRPDLYYRLQTHHVHVPPLRERLDDLPFLLDHFLEKAALALHKDKPTAPKELLDLLAVYSFPGNVRELESMVVDAVSNHHAGILSLSTFRQRIHPHTTPRTSPPKALMQSIPSCRDFPSLREATEFLIGEAMRLARGNQSIAAQLLGISRPALNRRLRHPRKARSASGESL